LSVPMDGDAELVRDVLATMQHSHADFTLTFRRLTLMVEDPGKQRELRELFAAESAIDRWLEDWRKRLADDPQASAERTASMRAANPAFIPRNHRVETALRSAETGDYSPFLELLGIVQRP